MPQHRPVQPLAQLCVSNILKHLDSLWCPDMLKQGGNFLYVVGPFDDLPHRLSQRIFEELKNRKRLKRHHIQLLVNAFWSDLNLSREYAEASTALQVASRRCGRSLQRLDLSWCAKLPRAIFVQSFPAFRNLRSLDLSHNQAVDDAHLAVVGVYGTLLEELNLNYTGVTDAGLLCLFMPLDEGGKSDDRYGKCQRLRSLKADHTHVDDDGAVRALLELEDLRHLGYHDSVSAVFDALQQQPHRTFGVATLSSTKADLTDEVLHSALLACPRISHLYLTTYSGMGPTSLRPLVGAAKELSEIHLTNSEGVCALNIGTSLEPVLQTHGSSLVSLNFTEVSGINVRRLLRLCPALQHLSLYFNVNYSADDDRGSRGGQQLKSSGLTTLTLRCLQLQSSEDASFENAEPDGEDLLQLLASPKLQSLNLSGCQNLTDDVVNNITGNSHRFPCLRSFELDKCDNVTMASLQCILLNDENPLKTVRLTNCEEICRKDSESYKKTLCSKGLKEEVSVEWL